MISTSSELVNGFTSPSDQVLSVYRDRVWFDNCWETERGITRRAEMRWGQRRGEIITNYWDNPPGRREKLIFVKMMNLYLYFKSRLKYQSLSQLFDGFKSVEIFIWARFSVKSLTNKCLNQHKMPSNIFYTVEISAWLDTSLDLEYKFQSCNALV